MLDLDCLILCDRTDSADVPYVFGKEVEGKMGKEIGIVLYSVEHVTKRRVQKGRKGKGINGSTDRKCSKRK
jgi:hypothetical protein